MCLVDRGWHLCLRCDPIFLAGPCRRQTAPPHVLFWAWLFPLGTIAWPPLLPHELRTTTSLGGRPHRIPVASVWHAPDSLCHTHGSVDHAWSPSNCPALRGPPQVGHLASVCWHLHHHRSTRFGRRTAKCHRGGQAQLCSRDLQHTNLHRHAHLLGSVYREPFQSPIAQTERVLPTSRPAPQHAGLR